MENIRNSGLRQAEKAPEEERKRKDEVYYIRHSRSGYETYAKNLKSNDPRQPVDYDRQVIPDLPESGRELAREEARNFFAGLDPQSDAAFFVSSNEARALETAKIYAEVAKEMGFEVIPPENPGSKAAKWIGHGDIRMLPTISLEIKDTFVNSVFNPESHLKNVNLGAVDEGTRKKWEQAREIINADDKGSWGANFFAHSEKIKAIFPEYIQSSKDLFDDSFQRIRRLVRFGMKKAVESGYPKNIKVLAFGHEDKVGYALDTYFDNHELGNCESVRFSLDDEKGNMELSYRGKKAEIK